MKWNMEETGKTSYRKEGNKDINKLRRILSKPELK
jgi:hypothetical protein